MYDPGREPQRLLAGLHPSDRKSWTSGGTAHILPAERARASFDHETLTTLLDGSRKATVKRRWIYGSHDSTEGPVADARKYDLPREEAIGKAMGNFMAVRCLPPTLAPN